jgi:outer membrane protein OmpA-like peptidoglycan-associated protein
MGTLKLSLLMLLALPCCSQDTPATPPSTDQNSTQVEPMEQTPVFRVNVVGRTTPAVNYHFRSGSTKVDMRGTELMPKATGSAKVESHLGRISVNATAHHLDDPKRFGTEYLTYVLWAISPEGRADNLGEIVPGDDRELNVTTDLQAFGLIVTAEPYFAVTRPSDVVVMENVIRKDTVGASELINSKYELIGRGGYIPPRNRDSFEPFVMDPKVPISLYEARNAVRIAKAAQADKYASDSYQKAYDLLQQAEGYQSRKYKEAKPVSTVSREAAQMAEDARAISLRRQETEYNDAQTAAMQKRESDARAAADESARQRAAAEAKSADDERARQQAEQDRQDALRRQQEAQAQADAASAAQRDALAAQQAAQQQQQQAQQEAERQRLAAQQADQARAAADQARQQAERDKEEMRARLLAQLNQVLETKDTARGLIVNMSDVLFDTGKYTLRPAAREKLAKISGIVQAYPDLKLAVEGHTDSVGSDAYNQRLSEQRADSVKSYLLKQGVADQNMTAQGLGEADPVADNKTAKGRQLNRRVELVVSGEAIGTKIGGQQQQQQQLPANDQTNQPK